MRTGVAGATLAAATLLLAACARNDGRTMQPPAPGATTPPPTSAAADTAGGAPNSPTFVLTSPEFADGSALPTASTCDGNGVPPALSWTEPPTQAVELVLVLTDADDGVANGSGDDIRWVVAGLPPDAGQILGGVTPPGAIDLGYQPPCPDPGEPAHVYVFTVYAVPSPLGIGLESTPADVAARLAATPAQAAQLTGFYRRGSG